MRNTDLYKGFGEIDDELTERAADDGKIAERNAAGEALEKTTVNSETETKALPKEERKEVRMMKKFNWRKIGTYAGCAVAACLVLVLGVNLLGFGHMGSAASYDAGTTEVYYGGASYDMAAAEVDWDYESEVAAEPAEMAVGSNGGSDLAIQNSGIRDKNVKLVYTAYMEVQTLDYSEAEAQIYALVDKFGGYLESTYRYNGSYYSDYDNQNGSYTVRIPAEHYAEFVNGLGDSCHVVNINQSVEDITLSYADVEKRLTTLETKYDRLLELLSKATEMSDIIELENAIAECEYDIDSYTSTKNRYDSLVNYSTITIELSEVSRLSDPVEVDNSFFARLGRTFKNGLDNVLDSLDDFVMWFSYNIVGIIIFAAIVIIIVKFLKKHPVRRNRDEI